MLVAVPASVSGVDWDGGSALGIVSGVSGVF
jgi:hypothetical protein